MKAAAAIVIPVGLLAGDAPAREAAKAGTAAGLRELTQAVRRGDEAAFAQFYDRYSLRLYQYVLALAKGDEPTAREVFQAVALKLTRKTEIFDDEGRLWAWLATLARHSYIDHWRARRRDDRRLAALAAEPDTSGGATPGWTEALPGALAELPPADRELLQAAYVDGRPIGELAAERGETYKAVESRLARLRAKTKAALLRILRHENAP